MNENWTTLKENWGTIQHAFVTYGPRVLFCAVVLVGIYGVAKLMKARLSVRKKSALPLDVQFLEEALDEEAPRKGNPYYTYAEFQEDLHNKGLTFEEIYEKCGGVFPKKPDEHSSLPGFQGHQGFTDFSQFGRSGFSGHSGYPGCSGYPIPPGGDRKYSDRTDELQMWFKKQGERVPIKGLVPPPPAPHTIIHKIFTRGRR